MGSVLPFPVPVSGGQVGFERSELSRIVDLYGRMVAAGLWKDYAIACEPGAAAFWAYRRAAEQPEYKIEKRPADRHGRWALIGPAGQVMRRGHELGPILAPLERRLMKLVAG